MKHLMKSTLMLAMVAFVASACTDGMDSPMSPEVESLAVQPMALETINTTLTPPSNEQSYVLYADQETPVGSVEVTTADGSLQVQYMVDQGYCMTEIHLQPFTDLDDVPTTGSGNPQVGKFTENVDYRPACVSETEVFEFPLSDFGTEPIMIAAHAEIAMPVEGSWEQVWQIGDVETKKTYPSGYFGLTNYADEFNWGSPAGEFTAGPGLNTESPAFADPFVVGTSVTSSFPYNSNSNRAYATDFDVEWTGALWFGGKLTVSWSPGQSAQEMKILSDGGVEAEFAAMGAPAPGQEWFLDTYPLVENDTDVGALSHGTHTINFRHTKGDGTFWDWVRLEQPEIAYESAWAGDVDCDIGPFDENDIGCDFEGRSWATYVIYTPSGGAYCPALELTNLEVLDITAPDGKDLSQNGPNQSEYPQIFFETLWEPGDGNVQSFGAYADFDNSEAGPPVTIDGPTCAYYVAYDPPTSGGTVEGNLTLPGDLFVGFAGVKGTDANDYLDNVLSDGTFTFPVYEGRWLEEEPDSNNDNLVEVSSDPDVVDIRVKVGGGNVDHFRFFTSPVY